MAAVTLHHPEPDVAERLKKQLGEQLSSTKVPRDIFVIDDFPRSEAGKVAKHKLRTLVG